MTLLPDKPHWTLQKKHYTFLLDALATSNVLSRDTKELVLVWLINLLTDSFPNFNRDKLTERYRKKIGG